jgi:hypothetical protein
MDLWPNNILNTGEREFVNYGLEEYIQNEDSREKNTKERKKW